MASGGSKQNTKLLFAVGLLIVAGVIIFLQLRGGGGGGGGGAEVKPMSEAQRAEHDRQVKAAEAAQRGTATIPPATTGGSN